MNPDNPGVVIVVLPENGEGEASSTRDNGAIPWLPLTPLDPNLKELIVAAIPKVGYLRSRLTVCKNGMNSRPRFVVSFRMNSILHVVRRQPTLIKSAMRQD